MTRPGIEPRSPGPLANTLTAGPIQESMTILYAHTKKVWKLIVCASYLTKYSKIVWMLERKILFFVKTYYKISSFNIIQAKLLRRFSFNTFPKGSQIFKLVKKWVSHDSCEDRRATVSSISRPLVTPSESAGGGGINPFALRIQQFFQLNDNHLKLLLLDSSWYFWFMLQTKWSLIQKCYPFTF